MNSNNKSYINLKIKVKMSLFTDSMILCVENPVEYFFKVLLGKRSPLSVGLGKLLGYESELLEVILPASGKTY